MIALRLHDRRDLRLHEEAPPIPAEDELLLRVSAVGLCGSDLHWFEDGRIGDASLTRPLVLGHEIVGVVAAGPRGRGRGCPRPAVPCRAGRRCLAGPEDPWLSPPLPGPSG